MDPEEGREEAREPRAPREGGPERPSLLRLGLVFYGVLLLLAWGFSALAGDPLFYAEAGDAARGWRPLRDTAAGVVAGALVVLLSRELATRTRAGEALARALAAVLGPLSLRSCVVLALASGVAEEAFFRGALQPHVGLVAASLLFGLVHFVPRRDFAPWTAFAVAAGFLFGWLFEATGNLWAPVLAHVLVNAINLRVLTTRYLPERTAPGG